MKKFELTSETKINIFGRKLFRIKALISFGDVKAGETGGWVEKEENVNQSGNAWVCDNAKVYGDAKVCDNAKVSGNAKVCDNAKVSGNAKVCDNAKVSGNAWVCDNAKVSGNAWVYGDAKVCGNAWVSGNAWVYGDAKVSGNADYATIHGFGTQFRTTTFFRCKDKKVRVACGCFFGTIPEFREQVKDTRKGKIAEEYLVIADLMEKHFEVKSNE
jgi:carbonic anhydrase/acetyltransferase-like protein (isoleucine patch superfamily)